MGVSERVPVTVLVLVAAPDSPEPLAAEIR
ncbi:hypothetical protein FB559_8530 [Actinoallomurus bryophytorum]|uniref:Uncharacterized protein n=1 Tax=Actinoallomurus bryophytorum TaxID=1490222 RepID=A0A543BSW1_9ACTN|nr:hypothetical protein FB559_8530 [Actinoallomurus bryophytorum]